VEADLINNSAVDFSFAPADVDAEIATDAECTQFIIHMIRYMGNPARGPLGRVLEHFRVGSMIIATADDINLLRDRLLAVDIFGIIDAFAEKVAPSLIVDLQHMAERVNYALQRLQRDAEMYASTVGAGGQQPGDRSTARQTHASRALKPGVGEAYHGPSAQPPVNVFEWLCAVDATFEAANASADVPLTDATKTAHVVSLLRGACLLDFKALYAVAHTQHPSIQRWALYDDGIYDFTAFFIDVHTTLDEREKTYSEYKIAKSKGYHADPGTLARGLLRLRNRIGVGPSTPSHLRIAPGALLSDFLAMLPAEMVLKIFNDVTFATLNSGKDVAVTTAHMTTAMQTTLAAPLPHDADSDALVFKAFNRAVEVAMTAYKAALSATSAATASSGARRAGLHALIPGADTCNPCAEDADDADRDDIAGRLLHIEEAIRALSAGKHDSRGGGGRRLTALDAMIDGEHPDAAMFASLAQRNYNAMKRREIAAINNGGTPEVRTDVRCYKCGKPGHMWRKCPEPGDNFVTPFRRFQQRRGMQPAKDEITIAKNYVNRRGNLMAINLFDDDDDMVEVDDDEIIYSTTTTGELFWIA
jgi:hypothetical protein